MMGLGVPRGAKKPYQLSTVYPGTPDSAIVGMSGNCSARLADVTARGRMRPAFTYVIAVDTVANMHCKFPASRSSIAGAPPLYGTCTIFTPARVLKISPAR